jgi:hypothetical protein
LFTGTFISSAQNTGDGFATITLLKTPATGLNFDGADDYIKLPSPQLANLNTFSFEAWVKMTPNIGSMAIYGEGNPTTLNQMFSIIPYGAGNMEIVLRNSSNIGLVVSGTVGTLTPGQWSHLAFVRTSATTAKLYVNGVNTDNFTFTDPGFIDVTVANIGIRQRSNIEYFFNGSMDDIRLWNRALCADEVAATMNCELGAAQTGLLSYYKFNQGNVGENNPTINTLTDAAGTKTGSLMNFALTGNTSNWTTGQATGTCAAFVAPVATISGPASACINAPATLTASIAGGLWTSNSPAVATINASTGVIAPLSQGTTQMVYTTACGAVSNFSFTVNALPSVSISATSAAVCAGLSTTLTTVSGGGNALHFNGSNTYVDLGTGVVLPTTFTEEAWIYSGSGNDGLFHGFLGTEAGVQRAPSMWIYNGKQIHGGFGNGSTFYYYITNEVILQNTWNHIAQTYDGTTLRCYVNGVQITSFQTFLAPPAGAVPYPTGVKNIGRVDNYFNGDMDEVRLWNIVRTPAQILADMNRSIAANTSGLVGYYKFSEGSGTTTADATAGARTGTFVNGPTWTVSSAPVGATISWSPSAGLNTTAGAIAIATPAATTTYTATATDASTLCVATANYTVTVNPLPTISSITGNTSICTGTATTLTAASAASGAVYKWYSAATGGTALFTGAAYTTPVLSANATYYAEVTNGSGCISARTPVTVIVNALPPTTIGISASGPLTFCAGGSVTLKASSAAGNALQFNGGNYTESVNSALPLGNASRTIEAWVKTTGGGAVVNWGTTLTQQRSGLLIIGGHVYYVGENNDLQGSINVADGNWHHIAATWNGATLRLYVDGNADNSAPLSTHNTTGTTLRIGRRSVGDAQTEYFNGSVDEVRIWNIAKTQAQIQASMNLNTAFNSTGLVAYYQLDETSGTSITDATANNATGTLFASPTRVSSGSHYQLQQLPMDYRRYRGRCIVDHDFHRRQLQRWYSPMPMVVQGVRLD